MDRLNAWIDAHKEELVAAAARLVRVESVGASGKENHPFGDGVAAALDEALALAGEWGLATRNYDYYVGTAQLGEGEPRLAVLGHLDTVPLGDGWTCDPLGGEVRDGRLFGRGAIDDKGPLAAALFAMRAISECGISLASPCRCVMGCDEETGSSDMAYYQTKETFPPFVFSPDADYPLINAEKGRIQLLISGGYRDYRLQWMHGGEALNAVPTVAEALLRDVSREEIAAAAAACGHPVEIAAQADGLRVITRGVAAHASTPDRGENAVTAMLEFLAALGIGGDAMKRIAQAFPFAEYDGASAGAACRDSSGPLTLALTRLKMECGGIFGMADIRFPVGETVESVKARLREGLQGICGVSFGHCVEGHYVPEDSPLVQTLLKVYEEQTGQPGRCLAIGGGTYVHEIENGVAFGAEFPGADNHMHGADESIIVDELIANARIFAHAILAICGETE